jgi:biopolymer transport protein ExbD
MSNKTLILVLAISFMLWLLTIFRSGKSVIVNFPMSERARQTQQINKIFVTVEADSDILLQGQPVELEHLKSSVESLIRNKQENLVILRVDKTVNYVHVMEVLERLRQIEGVKVGLATVDK